MILELFWRFLLVSVLAFGGEELRCYWSKEL